MPDAARLPTVAGLGAAPAGGDGVAEPPLGLYSRELGLYAYVLAGRPPRGGPGDGSLVEMRWHDPAAGSILPSVQESMARERREATLRRAAEQRIAELEARLRQGEG